MARKNPGKLTFATAGVRTTQHLSGELIKVRRRGACRLPGPGIQQLGRSGLPFSLDSQRGNEDEVGVQHVQAHKNEDDAAHHLE